MAVFKKKLCEVVISSVSAVLSSAIDLKVVVGYKDSIRLTSSEREFSWDLSGSCPFAIQYFRILLNNIISKIQTSASGLL